MKRFDSEGSFERQIDNLEKNSQNWKNISASRNGPLVELVKAQAESFNAASGYMEYLLAEKKWDTARNLTSLMHMARVLNKKANRKVSARGYALVSHTDVNGVNRLANLGNLFVDINTPSDYDDKVKSEQSTVLQRAAMVPWVNDSCYEITKGAKFSSNTGLNFVCTESTKVKTLTTAFSDIKKDEKLYKEFIENGGWAGYKYILVPIVEGSLKELSLGPSTGAPSQSTLLNTLSIEAANSAQTRDLLYVTVEGDLDENTEDGLKHWTEVDSIADAPSSAKVFELRINEDHSGTIILFGDGYNGAIPPEGKVITLHYLETQGGNGNLTQKYALNDSIDMGRKIIDPRSNSENGFLHVTNHLPIIGGKDLETKAQFKADAEKTYRKKTDVIFEAEDLRDNIYKYTPIPLYLVNVKKSKEQKSKIVNNITKIYRPVYISALNTEGDQLTQSEQALLIKSLNKYIGENNLVYNLDLEFSPYKLLMVDTNTAIELDHSKEIIASQSDFIKDVEDIIVYNNGLSAIEPGNNKLNVSSIDKQILDKYPKNISDIQTNLWLRSYMSSIELYYKGNRFDESSFGTSITKQQLVDGVKFSNRENAERFDLVISFKIDLGVANAKLGGSSLIKTGILGCNIPVLFNIVPPTTDIDSKAMSFALIDKAAAATPLYQIVGNNATVPKFNIEGESPKSWCEQYYASKYNGEYLKSVNYDSASVIYLAQLKNSGTFSLTDKEAIIKNNSIDSLDDLIANQNDDGFIVDAMAFRMGQSDGDIQISIPINEKTFATTSSEVNALAESLASLNSEVDLATVANAIKSSLQSYYFSASAQLIDRTLLSTDDNALMYVATSKASIISAEE